MSEKSTDAVSRSGHSLPCVPSSDSGSANRDGLTTERQPTENGPVAFPDCRHVDGMPRRLSCYVCHEAVKAGEMVYFIGQRPGSGALYRRHVTCARMPQKPKSDAPAVEPSGKAGPAANGRVVRSTRTFGG